MEKANAISPLVPLGAGIAIGGIALWALVELWPLIIIGAGAIVLFKGMGQRKGA